MFENADYVLLNNQKARIDNNIYTYDEIKNKKNYGVLIPPGYVMIDYDNLEYAKIVENIISDKKINCIRVNTDRGKHFIFKVKDNEFTNWTHRCTFLGLECDAKGNGTQQNKSCYECICRDGNVRDIKYYGENSTNNNIDYLPKMFYLNKTGKLMRLSEGDGRNEILFSYQIELINNKFTKEEARELSKIINDYVFIDKLSDKELETILRDEAYEKIRETKEKFLLDSFIENILSTNKIYTYDESLIWYIDNSYTSDEKYKIPGYIAKLTKGSNLTTTRIGDIMLKLKQSLNIKEKVPDSNYVLCGNNKLYNIQTGELTDNTDSVFTIINYNYEYDPDSINDLRADKESYNSAVKDFIYYCSCNKDGTYDELKNKELLQMIGNALIGNKALNRCYFIKGNGANGKSKLKVLIEKLTEGHNSFVMIDEFGSDFKRASMFNPNITCNLQDDFTDEVIKDVGLFKSVITGAKLIVNPKYGKSSIKKCNATFIICCNEWPRFKTEDDAIERRLMLFDLDNQPKIKNINLEKELIEDYQGQEWLFTESLKAITEAFKSGELIETQKSIEMKQIRNYEIDSTIEFLFEAYYKGKELLYNDNDEIVNQDYENIDIHLKSTEELLQEYAIWSGNNVSYLPSKKKFTQQINKYLSKYYTHKPVMTGDGTKRLWVKRM